MLPGFLVALHYATQVVRPRMGYGSDVGGRSTPWIIGGMAVLGAATLLAAFATTRMAGPGGAGMALAITGYVGIGLGVGAAGTSLLVLLAKRVAPARRAAAASVVWLMMIAGFAVTATVAGRFLDPYSPARLVEVTASVIGLAMLVTLAALWRLERGAATTQAGTTQAGSSGMRPRGDFRAALAEVWSEPKARRFTIFVFVSMLAYSAQDLILEPFAGVVFHNTVGESTTLAGIQHQGVFFGMLAVAVAGSLFNGRALGSLRMWTVTGCVGSAAALWALSLASLHGIGWPLKFNVFLLGLMNGAFAVAAIGSMMAFAGSGAPSREGTRMGLWGAAQATAFGLGGFLGTAASDTANALLGSAAPAYALVFGLEGLMFLVSAVLAAQLEQQPARKARISSKPAIS
jgi:BCD family chlorophyll transporter-like MFS transporter